MKKISLVLVVAGALLGGNAFAQSQVVRGPYLQSPTQTSMKIKWRTDVPTPSVVNVGTTQGNLNLVFADSTLKTDHTIHVTGLSHSTTYFYSVNTPDTVLSGADYTFKTFIPTSETSTTPFRVWSIGDFGKGNTEQAKVRDAYINHVGANNKADLWLWLGDNAYPDGTEQEYQDHVFDEARGYAGLMRNLPFLPCPGNHDYNSVSPITSTIAPLNHSGPYYSMADVYTNAEAGGVASGHELFYSFDYGNVHFVSLNSELGSVYNASHDWIGVRLFGTFTTSPMLEWLKQDLQANTLPWTVVFFHQPPYTDGSHDSEAFWEVYMKAMRENFTPVLEQYGVDLVLAGHSHVYERSYLMKGMHTNTFAPSMILQSSGGTVQTGGEYVKYTDGPYAGHGTVYVVNGNSGSKETDPRLQHPALYSTYGCDTCVGSLILDFAGNRVEGYHIDGDGVERDRFVIEKKTYPVSINEQKQEVLNWKVAPNPFNKETVLSYTLVEGGQTDVYLTDASGKRIPLSNEYKSAGDHSVTISADQFGLAAGAYTLFISSEGKTVAKTVIKM